MLGRLEFGRIGRQEQQMDMLGDAQLETGVPASAVQDEHDLLGLGWRRPGGEGGQLDLEERDGRRASPGGRRCAPRPDGQSRRDSASRSGVGPARSGAGRRSTRPCAGSASSRCGARRRPRARRSPAGTRWRPLGRAAAAFFERGLLCGIGQHVARARLAPLALQAHQVDPAHLRAHRAAERLAHPVGDQAPGPVVALGRWPAHGRGQCGQLLPREQRRRAVRVGVLPIVHPLGAFGVVALGDLADPVARIARALGDVLGRAGPAPAARGSATSCVRAALWPRGSVAPARRRSSQFGGECVLPCPHSTGT